MRLPPPLLSFNVDVILFNLILYTIIRLLIKLYMNCSSLLWFDVNFVTSWYVQFYYSFRLLLSADLHTSRLIWLSPCNLRICLSVYAHIGCRKMHIWCACLYRIYISAVYTSIDKQYRNGWSAFNAAFNVLFYCSLQWLEEFQNVDFNS